MFRFAVLYFILLIIFVALAVAPTVLGPSIGGSIPTDLAGFKLAQPTGQDNNDTTEEPTGGPNDAEGGGGGGGGGDDDMDGEDMGKFRFMVI